MYLQFIIQSSLMFEMKLISTLIKRKSCIVNLHIYCFLLIKPAKNLFLTVCITISDGLEPVTTSKLDGLELFATSKLLFVKKKSLKSD